MALPFYLRLAGGLGNQLFQLAAAINIAESSGREVSLDSSNFSRRFRKEARRLELPAETLPVGLSNLDPVLARILSRLPAPLALHESLGQIPDPRAYSVYACGYFQRFDSAIAAVGALRNYVEPIVGSADHDGEDFVAVHCRLGDYLKPDTKEVHGVTDPSWSIDQGFRLASEVGVSTLRVFTDSPGLLMEILGMRVTAEFHLDSSESAWDVLRVASKARGLVISNSSLSWWAAFIAGRIRGQPIPVVMPYPWMALPSHLDSDLRDPSWRIYSREVL